VAEKVTVAMFLSLSGLSTYEFNGLKTKEGDEHPAYPPEGHVTLNQTWSSRDLSLGLEMSRDPIFKVLVLKVLGLGLETSL